MKHLFRIFLTLCITAVIVCTVITTFSAEEVKSEETIVTVVSNEEDGEKAYDLVWKFKSENGHMYKRRWNNTTGMWYDPAWILVY